MRPKHPDKFVPVLCSLLKNSPMHCVIHVYSKEPVQHLRERGVGEMYGTIR